MTPEGNVKKRVKELLHRYNILPFKECLVLAKNNEMVHGYYSMPSSTGYGEAGIADFLCSLAGHYVEIETKATNGKLRGIQAAHGSVVNSSGGSYIVIRSEQDVTSLEVMLSRSLEIFITNTMIAKQIRQEMH